MVLEVTSYTVLGFMLGNDDIGHFGFDGNDFEMSERFQKNDSAQLNWLDLDICFERVFKRYHVCERMLFEQRMR